MKRNQTEKQGGEGKRRGLCDEESALLVPLILPNCLLQNSEFGKSSCPLNPGVFRRRMR
jgi:hypothetical protein